jgi:hypothetical protein
MAFTNETVTYIDLSRGTQRSEGGPGGHEVPERVPDALEDDDPGPSTSLIQRVGQRHGVGPIEVAGLRGGEQVSGLLPRAFDGVHHHGRAREQARR